MPRSNSDKPSSQRRWRNSSKRPATSLLLTGGVALIASIGLIWSLVMLNEVNGENADLKSMVAQAQAKQRRAQAALDDQLGAALKPPADTPTAVSPPPVILLPPAAPRPASTGFDTPTDHGAGNQTYQP